MGANTSPRAIRSAVLASKAADFKAHRLTLICSVCHDGERTYVVGDLARMAPGATVTELLNRMKCGRCHGQPAWIALRSPLGSAPRELVLRGS